MPADPIRMAEIKRRLEDAQPHLPKVDIEASRKPGTTAEWWTVAALVKAAPADLAFLHGRVDALEKVMREVRDCQEERCSGPHPIPGACPPGCKRAVRLIAAWRAFHAELSTSPEG